MADAQDRAVQLLGRVEEFLRECRELRRELERMPAGESAAAEAERAVYGIMMAALERGLLQTFHQALLALKDAKGFGLAPLSWTPIL